MLRRRMLLQQDNADKPIYGDFKLWRKWEAGDGLPDKSLWEYPVGKGTVTLRPDGTLSIWGTSNNSGDGYGALRAINFPIRKAMIDVTLQVNSASENGIRIVATNGDSVRGNQITINGNYLNVHTKNQALTTPTKTKPFSYSTYHNIVVSIDYEKNDNRVYLDGALITKVDNANLSTTYAGGSTWITAQYGSCYIKSIKIYK